MYQQDVMSLCFFSHGRCLFLGVKISTAQGWRVGTLGTTGSLPIELGTSQGGVEGWGLEFISSIFGMLELPRILLGPIVFVAQRRLKGGTMVWFGNNKTYQAGLTFPAFYDDGFGEFSTPTFRAMASGQPEAVIAWLSLGGGGSKGWEKFFMVQGEETKPFKTKILVSYLG